MPVKTVKKPAAKKPEPKKAAPAPKAVEKPKATPKAAEAPKAKAPKAQKAEPKADKKKTITPQEFHNLCIERSYEIWLERSKSQQPGDSDSDWRQAETELRKTYNVK